MGFHLTGRGAHDLIGADHLIPAMRADTLVADKASALTNGRSSRLSKREGKLSSHQRQTESSLRDDDKHTCTAQHLIENFFVKLSTIPRSQLDTIKPHEVFLAAVYLAASVIWLN